MNYRLAIPSKPDPTIEPDDVSKGVREATSLLTQAVERLKDARDLLDEAAQVDSLPEGVAGSFQAYEGVVDSLRRHLSEVAKWNDDKAELMFSRHSPLNRERHP